MKDYRDLIVWQKSMYVVELVYAHTKDFPKSELYGLVSQIRRSAISIPSNIAEGSKRGSRKDYRNFVLIAHGSCAELETQIEIAKRLNLISQEEFNMLWGSMEEIDKMLYVLQKRLQ